jgi:hypothetical protein
MNLIIPCAGESSRFPGTRPKWMLTQPNGKLMVDEAISGLNTENIDKIYVVILQKHAAQYECIDGINQAFKKAGHEEKFELVVLDNPTKSQPETIAQTILKKNITGPIFIKDCDAYFNAEIRPSNEVCTFDLSNMDMVHAANKSYVIQDEHGIITNIAEKHIISSTFCVGGYSFDSASVFLDFYTQIKHLDNLYVSHVIYQMMLSGITFETQQVTNYVDWGTLAEWSLYKSQFASLFIDIDGVIVKNSSQYFNPVWGETSGIDENIEVINDLYESDKVQIILTTARSEEFKSETESQLATLGVKYHKIIYELLHAKRIIVNDYAKTNPYKSCEAINIKRDSPELKDMLTDCLKRNQDINGK